METLSLFLATLISIVSIGPNFALIDLFKDSYEREFTGETTFSVEFDDDIKELIKQESEIEIPDFTFNTAYYSDIKNFVIYADSEAAVGDAVNLNFKGGINKDGVLIDKDSIKSFESAFNSIIAFVNGADNAEEMLSLTAYYDFNENNLFIPFSPYNKEEIEEEIGKESLDEEIAEIEKALSYIDIEKCIKTISDNEFVKYSYENGEVSISGNLKDFLSLTALLFKEGIKEEALPEDEKMFYEEMKEEIEIAMSDLESDKEMSMILSASVLSFRCKAEKNLINSGFELKMSIPSEMMDEELNAVLPETINLCTIKSTNMVSFKEEDVNRIKAEADSFFEESRKEVLYAQSKIAYKLNSVKQFKYFRCYYYKGNVAADSPISFVHAAVSFNEEPEYYIDENGETTGSSSEVAMFLTGMNGYLIDDRMYLPLRAICESMGCDVRWDDAEKKAYVTKNGTEVYMEGVLRNDRTYIKIRDFEKLGFMVDYTEGKAGNDVICCIRIN